MTHKCNICKKEMLSVDNIKLKEFLIKGWRCDCGQIHSDPEDVDKIIRYLRALNTEAIPYEFLSKIRNLPFVKSIEFGEFECDNNILVRVSDMSVQNVKNIHEIEYDFSQTFSGYVSILVLPI